MTNVQVTNLASTRELGASAYHGRCLEMEPIDASTALLGPFTLCWQRMRFLSKSVCFSRVKFQRQVKVQCMCWEKREETLHISWLIVISVLGKDIKADIS